MKEVRIVSVSLNNWRGQTREVIFDGQSAVISGRNHSGKSSVMNAFLWCVTGFDSEDRSNYLLYDDRVEQTHDNAVPADVEVVLSVDGEKTSLRRTATQGWVRRRGTDTYERSGSDSYTFFLDGIERSAGQFAQDVEFIFGAPKDKLKIMLNLAYFISMDWKTQRKHLGDIIGEVKESDFNDSDRFAFIFSDLQRFTIDEIRDKYRALLKPLKESMQRLPIEIDTMEQNIPSEEGISEARKEKESIDKDIDNIDRTISDRSAAVERAVDERTRALREISRKESELEEDRIGYMKHAGDNPELAEARNQLSDAIDRNRKAALQKTNAAYDIERMEARLKSLSAKSSWHEGERIRLKEELAKVKDRTFSEDKCPYCHRELPEDMLENARIRFNETVERDKASIVRQGKDNNAQWEKVTAEMKELEANIAKMRATTYGIVDIAPYEARIATLTASIPKYEETDAYREKMAQIEDMKANLPSVVDTPDNIELIERKRELRMKSDECMKVIAREGQIESMRRTIAGKREELKRTAEEMARCEGKVNAIAEYEREHAEIIRQRVNGLFGYCEVCMETTDKSGNTVPICIVKDKGGVDFRVTNTASQIACKVDMASAFQKFYGVSLPLFVDNCEAVNEDNMPSHDGQLIGLRVSENDFNVE